MLQWDFWLQGAAGLGGEGRAAGDLEPGAKKGLPKRRRRRLSRRSAGVLGSLASPIPNAHPISAAQGSAPKRWPVPGCSPSLRVLRFEVLWLPAPKGRVAPRKPPSAASGPGLPQGQGVQPGEAAGESKAASSTRRAKSMRWRSSWTNDCLDEEPASSWSPPGETEVPACLDVTTAGSWMVAGSLRASSVPALSLRRWARAGSHPRHVELGRP
ncbi:uncharacterized protein LOC142420008 [Mycteria americana]|uniref:uncharacterized protein LOC142420008 n=1 Tax=Mycteria americana TaxID=33587 RepID=UPI003F5890DB